MSVGLTIENAAALTTQIRSFTMAKMNGQIRPNLPYRLRE
jgi:hypothetical protein